MHTINDPTISSDEIVRPTLVEVDLHRLAGNFRAIRDHVAPARVMPILKANAYGHGLLRVAQLMESLGADYIGVAVLEEGILLRQNGIRMPILVLGGILGNQVPGFLKYNLAITASSIDKLAQVDEIAAQMGVKAKVHLKIDTGMERTGVHEYEARPFIESSLRCGHLQVEGIFSHFANSESADLGHARLQLERFHEVLGLYGALGAPVPPLRHMANSGAILQLPESHFDMVRPGVMFYGIYPERGIQQTVDVRPAATWHSHVNFSKITEAGRPVSYGSLWQSDAPTRIVTIPCGYADGYFRRMTNRAQVIVKGRKYPQVGRICMDQFMVNLGEDDAAVGDPVILLGTAPGGERISAEDLADWAGTNEYEVMTNISARVPRVAEPGRP